jgi:hypothetical protein
VILYYESAANEIPGQETHLAATDLNALKKLVDNALLPDNTDGACTLGGLVSHCWVEGDTQEDPKESSGSRQCLSFRYISWSLEEITMQAVLVQTIARKTIREKRKLQALRRRRPRGVLARMLHR